MIPIQGVQNIEFTERIDEVRRRIAEIEDKFGIGGIGGDFQKTLEREVARQAKQVTEAQKVTETQRTADAQKPIGTTRPVNENDAANAAKVAEALKPDKVEETKRVDVSDVDAAKRVDPPKPATESYLPGQEALPGANNPATNNPALNNPSAAISDFTPPDKVEDVDPERDDDSTKVLGEHAEYETTEDIIMQTAAQYGVDPELVRAIAIAESSMNQGAVSSVGAIGVMQLMPETAESLGVNPYDERENIDGGTRYIRQMLETFDGDVANAVAAYNAGPEAVRRYGGIPPYSETQNYVGRVMDMYR